MRLSKLQKYILNKCYNIKSAQPSDFLEFYKKGGEKNLRIIQNTIHKCLEKLTLNDLIVSFGKKTSKKWFISKVKLTRLGKKTIAQILKNRQRQLPIK